MKVDRTLKAFMAADRILNMIESAGMNWSEPRSILDAGDYPNHMQYCYGATRLVIWDDNCDYVLKIALDEVFEKYNKHEVEVYKDAVNEGLEDNFAWCDCYIEPCEDEDFYNPGVYVMEYLEGTDEEIYDRAWQHGYTRFCEENGREDSVDSIDAYYEEGYDDNDVLMELFTADWSISEKYDFNTFLYDNNINDIHSANVLYRGDRLVICDYAGYGW